MGYDILFQQAIKLHEQGDLNSAEKIYRQILETAPNNPDILNLLGLIAQYKRVHVEAINLFYEAIKEAPNHAPFYFNLAISLDAWGKPYEAIDAYQKALKIKPNILEAYNNIGEIYKNLNNFAKAREYYIKASDLDDAKANLAFLDKSILELEKLGNNQLAQYYLSLLYQEQGNLDKALEFALKTKDCGISDMIYSQIAEIYLDKGNVDLAEYNLKEALVLNPYSVPALVNLANIETNRKDFEKAEEKYKIALDISPNNINAHINYANLLYISKRPHEALEEYRKAVVINPDIPEISNNIAIIQRDFGEYERAIDLFFNALLKSPDREDFSINISETLVLMISGGKKDEAIKIAEKWVSLYPENTFAKHSLASIKGDIVINNNEYNEKLFDNFADNYESVLKKIEYKLPRKIKLLIGDVEGKILDIGCGTGLLGEVLKNAKNQIIGVDLSTKMLSKAKEKNIYKELIQEDITTYLEQNNDFDWIIAADVFGYIGHLDKIISLCKGKNLCFSIELLENSDIFSISETGRYKHSYKYILDLLNKYSFKNICKNEIELRLENNIPVKGALFICKQN